MKDTKKRFITLCIYVFVAWALSADWSIDHGIFVSLVVADLYMRRA